MLRHHSTNTILDILVLIDTKIKNFIVKKDENVVKIKIRLEKNSQLQKKTLYFI